MRYINADALKNAVKKKYGENYLSVTTAKVIDFILLIEDSPTAYKLNDKGFFPTYFEKRLVKKIEKWCADNEEKNNVENAVAFLHAYNLLDTERIFYKLREWEKPEKTGLIPVPQSEEET